MASTRETSIKNNDILFINDEIKKVELLKKEVKIQERFLSFISSINDIEIKKIWTEDINTQNKVVIEDTSHLQLLGKIFLSAYRQRYSPGTITRSFNAYNQKLNAYNELEKIQRGKEEIKIKEMLLALIEALKDDKFLSCNISNSNGSECFYVRSSMLAFPKILIETLECHYHTTYLSGETIRKNFEALDDSNQVSSEYDARHAHIRKTE